MTRFRVISFHNTTAFVSIFVDWETNGITSPLRQLDNKTIQSFRHKIERGGEGEERELCYFSHGASYATGGARRFIFSSVTTHGWSLTIERMRCRSRLYGGVCLCFVLFCLYRLVFCRASERKLLSESDIERLSTSNLLDRPDHPIRIPRIIHQTWKTNEVPEKWNRTVQSIIELNAPRFEYRLWTDEEIHRFVYEKDAQFYRNTFLTYPLDIQRVDAFRYFVLFHQGGLYIDMDNGCLRSLHTLFNALELVDPEGTHFCAFPRTVPVGVSNGFMIATPGHPLFQQLINHLWHFNHRFLIDYLTVMLSAGPLYLSLHEFYFRPLANVHVRVLDEIVYSSIYTWHAPGSSWHGRDAKVLLYIYHGLQQIPQWISLLLIVATVILFFLFVSVMCRKSRQFLQSRLNNQNWSSFIFHWTLALLEGVSRRTLLVRYPRRCFPNTPWHCPVRQIVCFSP